MKRLISIDKKEDILEKYRDTPISQLFEYHNLDLPFAEYKKAQLLVGMCMDNRKHLHMPDNFAYIIRSGGANLRFSEFKVSYAISVGGVRHIALIGHNNCGMVNLVSRKEEFIQGLIDASGWKREQAEGHFLHFAPMFELGNEMDFILSEAKRLRKQYPKIIIAPMFYLIENNKLYHIKED